MSRKKSNSTRKFKEFIKQNEQKAILGKKDNAFFKELNHLSKISNNTNQIQEEKNKETSTYNQRADIKDVDFAEVNNVIDFKNTTEEKELFLLQLLNALFIRNNYFKRVIMEFELIKQLPPFYISERDYKNILSENDTIKPEDLIPYFVYQLNCDKPLLIEPSKVKYSKIEAERAAKLIRGYYVINNKQPVSLNNKIFYKIDVKESLVRNMQTKINGMQEDFKNKQE